LHEKLATYLNIAQGKSNHNLPLLKSSGKKFKLKTNSALVTIKEGA
jgi:hypothetical protein